MSSEKSTETATGDRAGTDAGSDADADVDTPSATDVTASVGLVVAERRELCDDGASSINVSGDFNAPPVPVAAAVPNNGKKPGRRGPGPIRGLALQMVSGYPQGIELEQSSFLPASKNDVEMFARRKAAILKGTFCRG